MSERPDLLRIGRVEFRIERLVYATVVLMSVLVVYDGWDDLATYGGVAAVIIAPIIAIALAHLFAEVVEEHFVLQRPLTGAEWSRLAVDQVKVLVAAVPPLVVLGIGWVSPLDTRSTIALLLWTGVVTLVALALIAGYRSGFRGWRLLLAGLSGGAVGLVVISLQIVLKPY